MAIFKIINNPTEIALTDKWDPATKFNCKERIVDYKGRQYQIIEKKERNFSGLERFGRAFLGIIAVICTLSLALFSKLVRNLFIKSKANIRFAVLVQKNNLTSEKVTATNHSTSSSTTDSKTASNGTPQTQVVQKVLPFIEQNEKEIKDTMQKLKATANDVLAKDKQQESPLDFTLTEKQQQSLLEAEKKKFSIDPPTGIKIIRGACNFVLILDSIPGFVFKPIHDKQHAEKYIEVVERARQVVVEKNLHLIHVPESKLIEVGGQCFIMQEKADLVFGDYNEIKGIYSYCWKDKELESYIKTVFSQMLEFICETKFSDVKYDNIPLATDGRIALIDLDDHSMTTGLIAGGARKAHNGLLNYIPYEYFDDFLALAKTKLKEAVFQTLEKNFNSIKTRLQKKVKSKETYSQFCQKNMISCPSQCINSNLIKIFDDQKKQDFAVAIVNILNQKLSNSKNFSVQIGRTTILKINNCDPIWRSAQEIWGVGLRYCSHSESDVTFQTLLIETLEGLKNAGYLHKYKKSLYYPYVTIVC